jgi:hypothetical protein
MIFLKDTTRGRTGFEVRKAEPSALQGTLDNHTFSELTTSPVNNEINLCAFRIKVRGREDVACKAPSTRAPAGPCQLSLIKGQLQRERSPSPAWMHSFLN